MADLPTEIITSILSRLPVKSLLRFKCVSKPWCSLIKHPNFIKLHLNHAIQTNLPNIMLRHCYLDSINPNSDPPFQEAKAINYPYKTPIFGVEILGSCNGLVYITPDEDVYCIWNPTTQEFKRLPETPFGFDDNDNVFSYVHTIYHGFGYDDSSNDYKVVRIVGVDGSKSKYDVKLYSLRTNSWRKLKDLPSCDLLHKRVHGVLVNGGLHWAATTKESKMIISFDLGEERFKVVPQPDYEDDNFHMNVGVLGGCLCVLSNFYRVQMQLWVMMDYGVKESWTRLFSISQPGVIEVFEYLKPLCYTKDGKVLLEMDNKYLVLYDLNSRMVEKLDIRGISDWFESEIYVQSLVSVNTGNYVWEKQAKGRRDQKKNMFKGSSAFVL